MDQVKIGKFIVDLRRGKEMTQKELAETIGVSDRAISKWECGIALRMPGNVWALAGIVSAIIGLIIAGYYIPTETTVDLTLWTIGVTAAISMVPLVYGFLGKLLLLPIQSRLESIAEKLKYQA